MRKYIILFCLVLSLYASNGYADPQLLHSETGGSENEVQGSSTENAPIPSFVTTPTVAFTPSGFIEWGANADYVSHNYGNWLGEYLKGEVQTDPNNRWNAQILNQREFGSTGEYGNIGNTHTFNEDWFSSVTAGIGNGGLYLPRYRIDGFINRKWLDDRQLITTFGLGIDGAMDNIHKDQSVFLGATYYFKARWIVQGGIRINDSTPGDVYSTSQFIAMTQGKDKEYFITLRFGFGHEAYQVIGAGQTLENFPSQQLSLNWRKWVGQDWGLNLIGEQYHNPNYNRTGITLGVFKDF